MPVYVLWIPCLQRNLRITRNKIERINISDEGEFLVNASLNSISFEVKLSYMWEGVAQEMLFTPFQKPPSCFLYYQITKQTETTSKLAKTLETEFHQGLYHLFKGFFHDHAFHPADEDSIIHARFFKTIDDYFKESVSDADYYVEEYIKKFDVLNRNVNDHMSEMRNRLATPWNKIRYYLSTYRSFKRLIEIFCRYEGEFLYYKSLRNSVQEQLTNPKSVDERMRAIDGEIRIKQQLVESEFSYNSAVIGTNVSTIGTLIGVIGIVLSILVTCSDKSGRKLDNMNERLGQMDKEVLHTVKKVSAIEKTLNETAQSVLDIDSRIDSIDSNIKKVRFENVKIQKKSGVNNNR